MPHGPHLSDPVMRSRTCRLDDQPDWPMSGAKDAIRRKRRGRPPTGLERMVKKINEMRVANPDDRLVIVNTICNVETKDALAKFMAIDGHVQLTNWLGQAVDEGRQGLQLALLKLAARLPISGNMATSLEALVSELALKCGDRSVREQAKYALTQWQSEKPNVEHYSIVVGRTDRKVIFERDPEYFSDACSDEPARKKKRSEHSKSLQWAPEHKLEMVKIFHDPIEEMLQSGQEAVVQSNPSYIILPQTVWQTPHRLMIPEDCKFSQKGVNSTEKSVQANRVASVMELVYFKKDQVPPNPEPTSDEAQSVSTANPFYKDLKDLPAPVGGMLSDPVVLLDSHENSLALDELISADPSLMSDLFLETEDPQYQESNNDFNFPESNHFSSIRIRSPPPVRRERPRSPPPPVNRDHFGLPLPPSIPAVQSATVGQRRDDRREEFERGFPSHEPYPYLNPYSPEFEPAGFPERRIPLDHSRSQEHALMQRRFIEEYPRPRVEDRVNPPSRSQWSEYERRQNVPYGPDIDMRRSPMRFGPDRDGRPYVHRSQFRDPNFDGCRAVGNEPPPRYPPSFREDDRHFVYPPERRPYPPDMYERHPNDRYDDRRFTDAPPPRGPYRSVQPPPHFRPDNDRRASPRPIPEADRRPGVANRICKFFIMPRGCTLGDTCPYLHDASAVNKGGPGPFKRGRARGQHRGGMRTPQIRPNKEVDISEESTDPNSNVDQFGRLKKPPPTPAPAIQ
uniref:C3H1-type domain-containing protein n=1 Tax=Spongospora subterranea TaxID=70186 RepID=A0A0H5R994_9EUKA|eukprot:CRZ10698.1 hypothetical protein [Spongospora subterranea]